MRNYIGLSICLVVLVNLVSILSYRSQEVSRLVLRVELDDEFAEAVSVLSKLSSLSVAGSNLSAQGAQALESMEKLDTIAGLSKQDSANLRLLRPGIMIVEHE